MRAIRSGRSGAGALAVVAALGALQVSSGKLATAEEAQGHAPGLRGRLLGEPGGDAGPICPVTKGSSAKGSSTTDSSTTPPSITGSEAQGAAPVDSGVATFEDDAAQILSEAELRSIEGLLAALGARRLEDLSEADLRTVSKAPEGAAAWRAHLSEMAREEEGRRGLTDHAFPAPAAPDEAAGRDAVDLSDNDLEILARIVKGETWPGTPHEGEVAIASVVLNRVAGAGWPETVRAVAHQPWQFSCYNADVRGRLYWGHVRESARQAAVDAAAGEDPVHGATYYFNPYLVTPGWAKRLHFVRRIGTSARDTHDFYR